MRKLLPLAVALILVIVAGIFVIFSGKREGTVNPGKRDNDGGFDQAAFDGKLGLVAAAGKDTDRVIVWSAQDGKVTAWFATGMFDHMYHPLPVFSQALGKLILRGNLTRAESRKIGFWDGAHNIQFTYHDAELDYDADKYLFFSPGGNWIGAFDQKNEVSVHDAGSLKKVSGVTVGEYELLDKFSLALSIDGKFLFAQGIVYEGEGRDKKPAGRAYLLVNISAGSNIDLASGKPEFASQIYAAAFSPDSSMCAFDMDSGRRVRVVCVALGNILHEFNYSGGDRLRMLYWSSDGRYLACEYYLQSPGHNSVSLSVQILETGTGFRKINEITVSGVIIGFERNEIVSIRLGARSELYFTDVKTGKVRTVALASP